MRVIFAAILASLWTQTTFAASLAECRAIGNRQKIDLAVQDQNGYGTCYANTASLMLQNALGRTTPISFQHLALASQAHSKNKKSNPIGVIDGEGGHICSAVRAAKLEGICSDTNFDILKLKPVQQKSKLAVLPTTDDCVRSMQIMLEQFYQDLYVSNILEGLDFYTEDAAKTSDKDKAERYRKEAANYTRLRDLTLISEIDAANPDVKKWKLRPEVLPLIEAKIPTILDELKREGLGPFTNSPYLVFAPLFTDSPEMMKWLQVVGANLSIAIEMGAKNLKACKNAETSSGIMEVTTCQDSENDPLIEIEKLIASMNDVTEELPAKKNTPKLSQLNNYTQTVAPICAMELGVNKTALKSVQCHDLMTPGWRDGEPNNPSSAATRVNEIRDWTTSKLCSGKPVGVAVCLDFMLTPGNLDTDFCHSPAKDIKRFGRNGKNRNHAMTIVGYEIQSNGKTRFLVQNSWGQHCSFLNQKIAANKNAECEMSQGHPTGRFWISAEVLIRNSTTYSAITSP